MKFNNEISQKYLKENFAYDELTGQFSRLKTAGRIKSGTLSGSINQDGRVRIKINYKDYFAHRLAWLYVNGFMPTVEIDHINGDPLDNRISNLRLASHIENQQNHRLPHSHNKSGFLGVSAKRDKWRATLMINKKQMFIGVFDTPEIAHQAYLDAKRKHHAFCTI